MMYDTIVSFDYFIDWIGKTYGPKPKSIRDQILNMSIGRYENYILFINRLILYRFGNLIRG